MKVGECVNGAGARVLLVGPYDPECGEYTFLAPPLGVWRLAHGNTDIKVLDNPVDGVGYVTKNGAFAEISFSGRRFRDVTYPSAGHTGHTRSGPRIEGFV